MAPAPDDESNKKAKIHKVVSHNDWILKRRELLIQEKELTRKKAALAKKRQELPWEKVEQDYVFESKDGPVKLSELCGDDDEKSLVVWHFMFQEGDNGCKLCSFFLDGINGIYEHLKPRARFVAVALASPEDLEKVRAKKGWKFPMVSSKGNSFNKDYGVGWTQEDVDKGAAVYNYNRTWEYGTTAPGLSVFKKTPDGSVHHTYSSYGAGLADFNSTFAFLDVLPEGRNEEGKNNMWWVKQKEEYDA